MIKLFKCYLHISCASFPTSLNSILSVFSADHFIMCTDFLFSETFVIGLLTIMIKSLSSRGTFEHTLSFCGQKFSLCQTSDVTLNDHTHALLTQILLSCVCTKLSLHCAATYFLLLFDDLCMFVNNDLS